MRVFLLALSLLFPACSCERNALQVRDMSRNFERVCIQGYVHLYRPKGWSEETLLVQRLDHWGRPVPCDHPDEDPLHHYVKGPDNPAEKLR